MATPAKIITVQQTLSVDVIKQHPGPVQVALQLEVLIPAPINRAGRGTLHREVAASHGQGGSTICCPGCQVRCRGRSRSRSRGSSRAVDVLLIILNLIWYLLKVISYGLHQY